MEYQLITLSNGLRIVFKEAKLPVAHACVIINAGTRDEPTGKAGLAHFIEHLVFKKTAKRSNTQILNRLELVGADLNAYTTKEYTCLHASFLNEHLNRTLDLFEDILYHSQFPENELIKEKSVIRDEIASYKDSPEDSIVDDFEDLLFQNHPLGNNILGSLESLESFTKKDIQAFIKAYYTPENMVIGITANKSVKRITYICEKYFGSHISQAVPVERLPPPHTKAIYKVQHKPIYQVHYMTGVKAYNTYHPLKTALALTNNLLGGMGMSSRLNLEIREKHGIAYTIESNYSPLLDTGILNFYFGTDSNKMKKAEALLLKELKKIREIKLGPIQLMQAKRKFIGQIALGEENRMALIIALTKNVMIHGEAETLMQIFDRINQVNADQVLQVSNELLHPDMLSTLVIHPEQE